MIQETTHDLRIIYNLSQNMLNRTRMKLNCTNFNIINNACLFRYKLCYLLKLQGLYLRTGYETTR